MNTEQQQSHLTSASGGDASKTALSRVFNWKRHPSGVFFIALPLFVLGMGSLLLLAVLHAMHGDPWFLVIWFAAVALFVLGLWPIRSRLLETIQGR